MMMDSEIKDLIFRELDGNINVKIEECKYPYKNGVRIRTEGK